VLASPYLEEIRAEYSGDSTFNPRKGIAIVSEGGALSAELCCRAWRIQKRYMPLRERCGRRGGIFCSEASVPEPEQNPFADPWDVCRILFTLQC
jgi:hypothetical protein